MVGTMKFYARISFPVPDRRPSAFRQVSTSSGAFLAVSPLPCPSVPESIPYLIRFENVLQPFRDYFLGNDNFLHRPASADRHAVRLKLADSDVIVWVTFAIKDRGGSSSDKMH